MTVAHLYCDVEQLLVGWAPMAITCRAATDIPGGEPPDDLASVLAVQPFIQIVRVGGPNGKPGFDQPTVDWNCFGLSRTAAKATAIQLQTAVLTQLRGYSNPYGTVLDTDVLSGPSWRPYDNTSVRRFGFTTRLSVHSRT